MNALKAARVATFTYFALNGFLLGLWLVHIPTVEQRTGIDHAELGRLLLLLGLGAFVGMRIGGKVTDRVGVKLVVPVTGVACSLTAFLPGLAVDQWTLGAALLVFGIGQGLMDVSMNAHAVVVEKHYKRPVMSAFHATWSLGGVAAALTGARTLSWDLSPATTLGAAAALGVVVSLVTAKALLDEKEVHHVQPTGKRRVPRRIWIMAVLAGFVMLSEGSANDWSVLHLQDVLGASPEIAALAYGAFATTMTTGRLLADRIAAKVGPVAVLRWGAAIGALGIATAALSPWIWLALAGWAVAGAGLSGTVPQLFSAAGHAEAGAAAANVSRVAGLGYLGVLAGPAVIGWLTHVVPLNIAFLLPVAICVVASFSAGVLRTDADRERVAA
ncbi:MFS transporter [Lentzea flava]|uniref:MFS transporter n=1 Tax=Lentzea flava TaxID=103732 RepID=A0ABQ2UA34_9PSEU|nr:MFS transporter [Lentzea flava]MCP2196942.1 Sugar phosphate permease [Lentzea flava]GGU14366.1 MFS transporter [Lentzea flava]